MRHLLLKAGAAGACALALLFAHGPAAAVPSPAFDQGASLVIPVADDDLAVEEDLVPDEVPAGSEAGETSETPMKGHEKMDSESSGDIEDKMIDEIGPGAE